MTQANIQKTRTGTFVSAARWIIAGFNQHIDRLVALRAFDDRRYDFTRSGK